MHNFSIRAFAKVNLVLDVLGKTESGYHLIQTVLHEVPSLYDELHFEKSDEPLTYSTTSNELSFDAHNTVCRAVALFEKRFHVKVGGHLRLIKNIPIMAGLGGGSSDGAATLKLLARAYGVICCAVDTDTYAGVDSCHQPTCPLLSLAAEIGMDAPFFINGGTQLATHFGEILKPLPNASAYFDCTVIDSGIRVSTADAYKSLDLSRCGKNTHLTEKFLRALKDGDAPKMSSSLHNDFEVTFTPPINGNETMLSGSGGARFKVKL